MKITIELTGPLYFETVECFGFEVKDAALVCYEIVTVKSHVFRPYTGLVEVIEQDKRIRCVYAPGVWRKVVIKQEEVADDKREAKDDSVRQQG
jgi:hypothetical protein